MVMISRAEYKRIAAMRKTRKDARGSLGKVIWVQRPIQASKTSLTSKLDALAASWTKTRWRGMVGRCIWHDPCSYRTIEVAYHILPRSHYMIRWLPDNLVGVCMACNGDEMYNRGKPRIEDRHKSLLGSKKYEALKELSRIIPKFSRYEMLEMIGEFKTRIEIGDYKRFVPAPIWRRLPEQLNGIFEMEVA